MRNSIRTIKKLHRDLSDRIRYIKSLRKQVNESNRPDSLKDQYSIDEEARSLSKESRARHIAYCMNRGTEYDKIEQPRPDNTIGKFNYIAPSWEDIDKFRNEYRRMYEADVCTSEQSA